MLPISFATESDLYLIPLFVAFLLTVAWCLVLLSLPFAHERFWRSGARHAGKALLPRLGGVAMCLGFFGAVMLDPHLVLTRDIVGLLIGGALACLFGMWDDFRELSFKAQSFMQVVLTIILFIFGTRVVVLKNPFGEALVFMEPDPFVILLSFLLLLGWLVLVMNAVNWLDGLDGLLGGVSLITFCVVFFLSLKPEVNQPPVALLAIITAGTVAGFLLFNVYPAHILAGTAGSMFIGFLITALAVIAGTKIATALLVLSLPIADALWVIGERLRSGQSMFDPDQRHLHYKLRELGWSERKIALFFFILTAFIGFIALNTVALGKFIAFLLVFGVIFAFLFFVNHAIHKKYYGTI